MQIIQLNKFSHLHDGKKIIFCKTDFLLDEFKNIRNLNNEVILITGNSDYPILDNILNVMPPNIKRWYGQNILSFHEKIIPIPMGIENKFESIRFGHGIGYPERVEIKENLLNRNLDVIPSKKIYANFQVNTNRSHRQKIKEICIESPDIDWSNPTLSLEDFFNDILNYEMVICPAGNGVDTHRIWEVLYSNRIPITIKIGAYKIYELYEKLPIIILDNAEQLYNLELIQDKKIKIKKKYENIQMIDFDFWKQQITNLI